MQSNQLSQEELTEVLRRAQEIDSASHSISGIEEYVTAAEEAGVSREATLLALRERLGVPIALPTVGEMVFAKSSDGHFYTATVQNVGDKLVSVRFMNGSDAKVPIGEIREFALNPGQKLNYHSNGMWWDAEIVRFNSEARSITMNLWGAEETVTLDKVRIRKPTSFELNKSLGLWINRAAIFLAGTGAGMILMKILTRG
jgi:hypothetical protein